MARAAAPRPGRKRRPAAPSDDAIRDFLRGQGMAWLALPNIVGRSPIAGIAAPGQGELLAPLTARYFEAIAGVWERRSSEVAQTVVVGLYPYWDISDEGVAAADRFLSGSELPPALRRLVLEGQAGVKRSLRARRFDTAGEQ